MTPRTPRCSRTPCGEVVAPEVPDPGQHRPAPRGGRAVHGPGPCAPHAGMHTADPSSNGAWFTSRTSRRGRSPVACGSWPSSRSVSRRARTERDGGRGPSGSLRRRRTSVPIDPVEAGCCGPGHRVHDERPVGGPDAAQHTSVAVGPRAQTTARSRGERSTANSSGDPARRTPRCLRRPPGSRPAAVTGYVTRDHRRIPAESQPDLLVCKPSAGHARSPPDRPTSTSRARRASSPTDLTRSNAMTG